MPSIALCVMSKEYDDDIRRIINDYSKYFDQVYIQINGTNKLPKDKDNVHFSYFKWIDDFSAARNDLLKQVKTDFWLWIDSDDSIINPENLKLVVNHMEANSIDIAFFQYHYNYDSNGKVLNIYWRERLIKSNTSLVWKEPVHESLDAQGKNIKIIKINDVIINHANRPNEITISSAKRNLKILLDQYNNGDRRGLTLYYIGTSYAVMNQFNRAIEFHELAEQDKSDPALNYENYIRAVPSLIKVKDFEKAEDKYKKAIILMPETADAYIYLGSFLLDNSKNRTHEAIEYLEKGLTLKPFESNMPQNSQIGSYEPYWTTAVAYFELGDYENSKKYIDIVAKFEVNDPRFPEIFSHITSTYENEKNVKSILLKAKKLDNKQLRKYLNSINYQYLHDRRVKKYVSKIYKPKIWSKKSIAFVCYYSPEIWGPESIKDGIGGSEEAVIYLSEELAKLGWEITVFTNNPLEQEVKGVKWKYLQNLRTSDKFNIFISWRDPLIFERFEIDAKIKALDLHDIPSQQITPDTYNEIDLVFFKSLYHRAYLNTLDSSKAIIISNGIKASQFNTKNIKRNPLKVFYGSSSERGLEVLVNLWPMVKKEVPNADLSWAYGWNTFDIIKQDNPNAIVWKNNLIEKMKAVGLKDLGRLNHQDLAKEMLSSGVWAYPCVFEEINCITALKTQASGMEPITSGYAALQESVLQKSELIVNNIYDNENQQMIFAQRLIQALLNPLSNNERDSMSNTVKELYNWSNIAKKWNYILNLKLK